MKKKFLVCIKQNTTNPSFNEVKINLCNTSQSIFLFTIGLYLFDTLLSILVLKKKDTNPKDP